MLIQYLENPFSTNKKYFDSNGKLIQISSIVDYQTWSWDEMLINSRTTYAQLFYQKSDYEDDIPSALLNNFQYYYNKLKSFAKTIVAGKANIEVREFYEYLPENLLASIINSKTSISDYILKNYKKPRNYQTLLEMHKILNKVKYRTLDYPNKTNFIDYTLFGTKTGRLGTNKKSFPILRFDKEDRNKLKPNKKYFIEFDINAAEIRTFISMLKLEQPTGDVYVFLSKKYNIGSSRPEAKQKVLVWLYDLVSYNKELDNFYNKNILLEQYFNNNIITTPYDRKIRSDKKSALNNLLQSTTADIFYEQIVNLNKILLGGDEIAFFMHDAIILDCNTLDNIDLYNRVLSNTQFGNFMMNIKFGTDYGNMQKI